MNKFWKATTKDPHVNICVCTSDQTQASTPETVSAHKLLAQEALWNYAGSQGHQLTRSLEEITVMPPAVKEVAWLCDYGSPRCPHPISATVYQEPPFKST